MVTVIVLIACLISELFGACPDYIPIGAGAIVEGIAVAFLAFCWFVIRPIEEKKNEVKEDDEF